MLHSVQGCPTTRKRYCGPSALSVITGLRYMDSLMLLKAEKQKSYNDRSKAVSSIVIKGTHPAYMRRALEKLGYRLQSVKITPGITFAKWLRERSPELRKEMVLVVAGNHYMVAQGNKACDGIVGDPVFISKMKGRRKRMETAHIVVKVGDAAAVTRSTIASTTRKVEEELKTRGKDVAQRAAKARQVKKLVAQMEMTFSTVDHGYSFELFPKDGFLLEHLASHLYSGADRWDMALADLERWIATGEQQEPDPDYDFEEEKAA